VEVTFLLNLFMNLSETIHNVPRPAKEEKLNFWQMLVKKKINKKKREITKKLYIYINNNIIIVFLKKIQSIKKKFLFFFHKLKINFEFNFLILF
jgi:hypothetical protein